VEHFLPSPILSVNNLDRYFPLPALRHL
jgi:hypothetical protein